MSKYNQCKTVAETIRLLQELPDPENNTIIFDYIGEEDVWLDLAGQNDDQGSFIGRDTAREVMRELDRENDFKVSLMHPGDTSINNEVFRVGKIIGVLS